MQTLEGIHYRTLKPVRIEIADDGLIAAVDDLDTDASASLPYIAPGFLDIQINGYGGRWFSDPGLSVADVHSVAQSLAAAGTPRFFPTLITASRDILEHGLSMVAAACDEDPHLAEALPGIHLEGPYISRDDGPRGAHPPDDVRPADVSEFAALQKISGDRIRLLTLAPEVEGAIELIRAAVGQGVVVSIGHSSADAEQIAAAVQAGATLSTHLGNGAAGMLPRHPNLIWEQLADDRLMASIISDGAHLPNSVLKCFLRAKGLARIVVTCDVSGFAGCPPGVYRKMGVEVEVIENGPIVIAGQRQLLAGSGSTTGDCVARLRSACDLSIAEAVSTVTDNPARLLRQPLYSLQPGHPATLTLFHLRDQHTFLPAATFLNGRLTGGAADD